MNKAFFSHSMYFHIDYNCFVNQLYHKTKIICKKRVTCQGLKNPLALCPGLVISTFGLVEIISCMPDGLVKIYIGYWQTCQYSRIYLYYGFSLLHIFSLVLQPWMSAYIRKTDWYIFQSPKTIKTWTTKHYASLNQWYNTG